jgi:hypothetical protein
VDEVVEILANTVLQATAHSVYTSCLHLAGYLRQPIKMPMTFKSMALAYLPTRRTIVHCSLEGIWRIWSTQRRNRERQGEWNCRRGRLSFAQSSRTVKGCPQNCTDRTMSQCLYPLSCLLHKYSNMRVLLIPCNDESCGCLNVRIATNRFCVRIPVPSTTIVFLNLFFILWQVGPAWIRRY